MGRGTKSYAGVILLVTAALAGSARSAAAAELVLEQPAECVTLDELSFRVERLLGQPLIQLEPVQLTVRVEATAAGASARIAVARAAAREQGVRTLRAESCAALLETLAIAVVVAIGDGQDAPAPRPAEPARPEPPGAEPASATPALDAPPPHEDDAPGPAFAASLWAVGDSGTLPEGALGAELSVGLAWRSLELRAFGTLLPEREGTLVASDPRSPGVSIGLLAGGAAACLPLALQAANIGMAVCGGVELGELSGSGTRVLTPYQRDTLWAAARFELAARLRLPSTPLALELLVTALAPVRRDEFILKDLGEVHRPASVVGRLGVGLSVRLD